MRRLIKKYQLGKELVARNDAILHVMPPVKSIIWTREPKSPDASIHEIQLNPDGSIGGIGISHPGLTDLLLKDKSAVERLHGRPYTNRLYLGLQRRLHNSNIRDIQMGTMGGGAAIGLASLLSGTARFGGNPGITSSGVKLIPALDPGNIAGYANAAGLVTADPYNLKTYTNPDVWTAVLPFLPKYAKLNPKTGKYSKDGVIPSGLASFGTSEHLYDIDGALINLLLADLKSNPYSYLSRALRGEINDPDYLKAVKQIESGNYPFFSKVGALPNALQLIEAAAQGNENRVYAAVRKGQANYPGRTGYAPRVDEKSGVDFGGMVYLTSSPEVAINYSVASLGQLTLGNKVMDIIDRSNLKFSDAHLLAIRNKIADIEQFLIDHNIKLSATRVEEMKKSGKYNIGGYNAGGSKSGQYDWQRMVDDAALQGTPILLNTRGNGAMRAEFEKVNLNPQEIEELDKMYSDLNALLGNQGLSIGGSRAGIVALEDLLDENAIKVGNFDWNGATYNKGIPYELPFEGKKSGNELTRWLNDNGYDVGVIQNIGDPSLGNNIVVRNGNQFILARKFGGKLINRYNNERSKLNQSN